MEKTVPESLNPREGEEAKLHEKIREGLRGIIDPGTGLDVLRMGLVRDTQLQREGERYKAILTFRPSSPVCPMALMRIAVPNAQGVLCPHFGHCETFALIDVDQGKIVKTEYQTPPPHEPGVLPAWLHQLGVNTIICGGMGMRAQQLFAQNDIRVVYGAPSLPVEEIIRAHLDGKLVTGDNICDH